MNRTSSSSSSPALNLEAGMPSAPLGGYDVLLLPRSGGRRDEPLRFAPGNDVGNQRFRVLLVLYRRRYLDAHARGDGAACRAIAEEVLETVCDRCVPNGRFFEQRLDGRNNSDGYGSGSSSSGGGWRQLGRHDASTLEVVRRALEDEPIESTPLLSDEDDIICDVTVGCGGEGGGPAPPNSSSSGYLEVLCQAAASTVPVVTPEEESVASPARFDVVCDAEGRNVSKDKRYTGNNRLKVVLAMRLREYTATDSEGRRRMAAEVVSSIVDDAAACYLRENELSGMYEVLSREAAVVCTKRAFDSVARKAKAGTRRSHHKKRKRDYSEAKKLVMRKNKRAILDRVEKNGHSKNTTKGGAVVVDEVMSMGMDVHKDLVAYSKAAAVPPPTRFLSLLQHNPVVPKAA